MERNTVVPMLYFALVAVGWLSPGYAAENRLRPLPGVFIEAKDLTSAEMAHVRRLARLTGKEPWLIYGFRHRYRTTSGARRTSLEIYLQPDLENGRLRRGRVLHLEILAPAGAGQKASQRIESTAKYAHVVVLGRGPNEVNEKWDAHRPFLVDGDFDDETLFGLVAFIRRSPEGRPPPNGEPAAKINGSLAMSRVRRIKNGVEVTLNRDDYHGESVTVETAQRAVRDSRARHLGRVGVRPLSRSPAPANAMLIESSE